MFKVVVFLFFFQMFTFGNDRSNFSDVVNRGELTLRHLLLKDWDASWETLPFPPAQGDFAVYDIEELKERINFAVERVCVCEGLAKKSISYGDSFLPSSAGIFKNAIRF